MFKPMKYKEICEFMGDKVKNGGKCREIQLSRWQQYYDIEKIGTYYYIKKKYDDDEIKLRTTPKQRRDMAYDKQFNVNDDDKFKGGVYKIVYENNIYIGQTNNFYNRFAVHYSKGSRTNGHPLVAKGGIFEIIEIEEDKNKRLERETYWSYYYKELGYNLYNNIDVLYRHINENKRKIKFKNIKVPKENYNKAIKLLKKEGLI